MLIHSPKDLALFVLTHRKKMKLSQGALAERVGLKQQTVSAFEKQPERTKVDTLFRILSAVHLDIMINPKTIENTHTEW